MWLETMIEDMADVPAAATASLAQLQACDRHSKEQMTALAADEAALFESLKAAQARDGAALDDGLFTAQARALLHRRAALTSLLEEQSRLAQAAYNRIDDNVTAFDRRTAPLEHLLLLDPSETLSKRKKKKKKKADPSAMQMVDADGNPMDVDPNEPVYCSCRGVSSGSMVGCDSEDCQFEWFHLACVGLTEQDQPKDDEKWWCADCRARLGM